MNRETKTGPDRLLRMRRMFAAKGGILEEDYNYFTRRGEPTPRSRVGKPRGSILKKGYCFGGCLLLLSSGDKYRLEKRGKTI